MPLGQTISRAYYTMVQRAQLMVRPRMRKEGPRVEVQEAHSVQEAEVGGGARRAASRTGRRVSGLGGVRLTPLTGWGTLGAFCGVGPVGPMPQKPLVN